MYNLVLVYHCARASLLKNLPVCPPSSMFFVCVSMNGVRAPSSGVRVPRCDVMSVSQYPVVRAQARVRDGHSLQIVVDDDVSASVGTCTADRAWEGGGGALLQHWIVDRGRQACEVLVNERGGISPSSTWP